MAATTRGSRRARRRRPSRATAKRKAARPKRRARASVQTAPGEEGGPQEEGGPPAEEEDEEGEEGRPPEDRPDAQGEGDHQEATSPPARSARETSDAPPSVLGRTRRQLSEEERMAGSDSAAELVPDRMMQAARAGHDEMRIRLQRHTETSPVLTAGDPDARWEDAYAVGDEAPGGDNPTPDQDRVDDIGKALGIQYRDDQELRGGDEVTERDRRRWELDPASSDDWPHDKKKK